jgi:hypothetical protein
VRPSTGSGRGKIFFGIEKNLMLSLPKHALRLSQSICCPASSSTMTDAFSPIMIRTAFIVIT